MYLSDQLSVKVKIPMTFQWSSISGIKQAVQVFPDDPVLEGWYVVYVEPSFLDNVKMALSNHPGVLDCQGVPMRTIQ